MITESSVLRYLRLFLGQRFILKDSKFYLEIINEFSLPTFSIYYPYRISGIVIRESDGIKEFNPTTQKYAISKYKIPKYGREIEYLDLANYYYPFNDSNVSYLNPYLNTGLVSTLAASRIFAALPHTNTPYTLDFEAPDLIVIDPVPYSHTNFTIDMKCVNKLNQIPPTYKDKFMELALIDVKIALYNEFINARSSGNFGGMELNAMLDDFSSAEQDRKELIRFFREDSPKFHRNFKDYFSKISY